MTETDRIARLVYFAALPLVGTLVYAGVYALSWDLPMSVLYGSLAGAGAHALVGWAILPVDAD